MCLPLLPILFLASMVSLQFSENFLARDLPLEALDLLSIRVQTGLNISDIEVSRNCEIIIRASLTDSN